MDFFRNSLSSSATSLSRASNPSLRVFSAKLTIICTIPTRLGSWETKVLFSPPPMAFSLSAGFARIVAPNAPPIVIIMEGTSM